MPNNDHSYTELSDVPTELYERESDSQDDIITTGGKVIISSSDKVEISVEYQCENPLPDATKEGTETVTTPQMTNLKHQQHAKQSSKEPINIPDETEILPDDTTHSKSLLPDKTTKEVLPDKTTEDNNTVLPDRPELANVLPDNTASGSIVLSDVTSNSTQQLSVSNTTSTDVYPDTTATTTPLREETDTPNEDIPTANEVVTNKTGKNRTDESKSDVFLVKRKEDLPDGMKCPSGPLPEATIKNTTSNLDERRDSIQVEVDSQDSSNSYDTVETDKMQQILVGEITFTEKDTTLNNTDESKESKEIKDRPMLEDMSQGFSSMQPLETSSVISEPTEGGATTEPTTTTSTSSSSDSSNNRLATRSENEKGKDARWAKKNRLKSCIIKLMELSNSDHEKCLLGGNSSSCTNRSTESVDSSSSTGLRYNMRNRKTSTSTHPARST